MTLAVGLMLLTLVTLLSLAAVGSAHFERVLAQNDSFRENAASAASAGIEMAIRAIETSSSPTTVPVHVSGNLPDSGDRFEADVNFLGSETSLPQEPTAHIAGAHFEIVSTGFSARRAVDRQRAVILWVVDSPDDSAAADCEPLAARHCHRAGQLERLSWQRVPIQ